MAKLLPKFILDNCPALPYMLELHFPYRADLPGKLKVYPGITYAPELGKGTWILPIEAAPWVCELAHREGFGVLDRSNAFSKSKKPRKEKKLYPYQNETRARILQAPSSLRNTMIAYEMGLGKTATAIRTIAREKGQVLILCPSIVRPVWESEIQKWAPKIAKRVITIETSKDLNAKWATSNSIVIMSYGIFTRNAIALALDFSPKAVILDESHYLAKATSKRSRAVAAFSRENPHTLILELTGTPISNLPENLWNQLNILYPGRYGTFFQFCKRYCVAKENIYTKSGFSYSGLNDVFAHELKARLAEVCHRVTKKEVAHLLPAFRLSRISVKGSDFSGGFTEKAYSSWLEAQTDTRVEATIAWVQNKLTTVDHVAINCNFRKTAEKLGKELTSKKVAPTIIRIDGRTPIRERERMITEARGSKSSVVIATIGSIGIGINALAAYSHALFAELSFWPAACLQAIARYYRLGAQDDVGIDVLVSSAAIDQVIESNLRKKIRDINTVIAEGTTEETLELAVSDSDTGWVERLCDLVTKIETEEEEY